MRKNRGGNKGRINKPLRHQERNCVAEGVYSNNYFMHAATSHVGAVVKVETVQGAVYEGIFKTFSHEFDIVLELAHKVDTEDPQKLNAHEVIDNLIFHVKDIVNMCAPNVEPDYAFNTANTSATFLTDASISKCNGEITGEKDLQPWEDPMCNGGEECDLDNADTTQNGGWDVNEMFSTNEKFGVQTTYDESLSDYTCQINRKDTKDFKEDEAKAARIAMEIERNPSSQNRSQLENGDNEEDLYAAVARPGNESDGSKYIPPARRNNQPHRTGGGNTRMNYPPNGNGGRPPKNNAAPQPRYMHQTSQQYHAQAYGTHPPMVRDSSGRSSSENKNSQMSTSQSSNMSAYPPANVHGQQRSYPPNPVTVANHSPQNVSLQQPKPQRTSPISVNTLPNGNTDYQPKSLPPVSHSPPHQYHNQSQPPNAGGNNALNAQQQQQRKHHQSHHHHQNNSRVREEQINDLKKFGNDFNLSYDMKHKDAGDGPKQIQVVTNRNKSPPVSQTSVPVVTERNVVPVTIVSTLPPNKFTASTPLTTPPQSVLGTSVSAVTTAGPASTVPTTQVSHKQHPIVLPTQYQQTMQLQQRGDPPMLLPHQAPPMTSAAPPHASHHPQSMQPPPPQQQGIMQQKQPPHKMHMLPQGVPPPQPPVQLQPHPATSPQQTNTVINASIAAVAAGAPPQPIVTQPTVPQQAGVSPPQAGGLPLNAHQQQRPPLQQQPTPLKSQTPSTVSPTNLSASPPIIEGIPDADAVKGKDSDIAVDDVSQRVKNVRLNPDAKEYIPAVKSFTPMTNVGLQRSPSTPNQSRPHSPHTPGPYSIHPGNAPVAAGIQMMMPAYVVAASPGHVPPPPQQTRLRKTPVNSHRTSEYHTSNIPVSAVTGQPLLAPSPLPLSQSHIGHGTSFSLPAYTHYPQLVASHHSPVQMIRMVHQPGSMVPLVPNTIGYHEPGTNATAVYMNPNSSAAVAMAQHTQHVHHSQQHPPPSTAPSQSQTAQGQAQTHAPNNYQHPPLAAQNASPYPTPIMCPVIAQPAHGPPHMVSAQAQQHATVQQYMTQHPSVNPPHILSIIPHSCS